ncbi:hypothetical protein ES708_20478 [subsurface metagenome]
MIKWTPTAKGNYAVVVKVSDGALDITQSFTIVVSDAPPPVNHAPIITSNPNLASLTTIVGIQYTYTIKATDPDGDTLTYSLIANPSGMAIDSNTGNITWMPESTGSYDVTVKASDGKLSDTQSFTITVRELELELVGIEVEPKEMNLFVEGSETIVSVTATYEFRGYGVLVPLGDCTFLSTDEDIVTVEKADDVVTVKAVKVGTATIIVSYGGKTDIVEVTVIDLVHNINQETYYHTIQVAVNEADACDTIEVSEGTYNENINIDKSLTIVSVEGQEVTIINAQGALIAVLINGAETTATFDGFTVKNYETIGILAGAFAVTWGDDPYEVHILNNIVEEPGAEDKHNNCIQVGDGTTGTVIGNEVFGAWLVSPNYSGSGILVAGSNDVLISDNYVHDCEGGIQIVGYAEYHDTPAENNLIEDNLVENCETGISVQMNSIGTIIRYNDVLNNDEGIAVMAMDSAAWGENSAPSGTEIHYNNIFGNTEYGVKSSKWFNDGVVFAEEVNATYNWWGSEYGPKHDEQPEDGGDAVSDNVDYEHFLTSEY